MSISIIYTLPVPVKVMLIMVTIGATDRWGKYKEQEDTVGVMNAVLLLISTLFFNHPYLVVILLASVPTIIVMTKVTVHRQGRYLDDKLIELKKMNNSLLMQNIEYEKGYEKYKNIAIEVSGEANRTRDNLKYLFSEMYEEFHNGRDTESIAVLCLKLSKAYSNPTLVWPISNFDLFNHLNTKRDITKAIRSLTNYRKDNYLGEGFDREIEHYIDILEGMKANVDSRTKQKR